MGWNGGRVSASVADFEDAFDFHRDVSWQRTHANSAAGTNTGLLAPDLGKQFTAAIDDLGVVGEFRRAVDHSEQFDDAFDPVEAAELLLQRGQQGQPGLSCRSVALGEVQIIPDAAPDHAAIRQIWTMSGDIGHVADDNDRLVDASFGRSWREGDAEGNELGFSGHGEEE